MKTEEEEEMIFRFLFLSMKGENNMYLMHKDKFVAKLTTYQGIIVGVSEVYNKKLLPIGMQGSKEFADWKILTWLTNRMIPRTR